MGRSVNNFPSRRRMVLQRLHIITCSNMKDSRSFQRIVINPEDERNKRISRAVYVANTSLFTIENALVHCKFVTGTGPAATLTVWRR